MADAVIYALGGGMGHLMRAIQVAARVGEPRAAPVRVLHQARWTPPAPGCALTSLPAEADGAWVRDWLRGALTPSHTLVVDTFPGGIAHELDDATLRCAGRAVLIQRHLKRHRYRDYDALAARFDERWLPYPPERCAWEGEVTGRWVGSLTRALPVAPGAPASLAVLGDPARLPAGWRARLPADTVVVDRFVAALPPAERYLGIGAGHNLCWELVNAGVRARHLPLERRYDDQHRRALRLGRALTGRADLEALLAGP